MMKIFLAVLLLVGIAIASDVKVLTTQSFDAETASGEWLLEFYAPWCGHCKNLIPTYEELATKVKDQFNVAKIDCTIEKALQQRFGIRGFPTIKFLKDGKVYDYAGQRKVDAFVEFMNSGYSSAASVALPDPVAAAPAATAADSSKPSNVVTLTNSNFEELTSKGTWFLEFYAPWCGHCKRLAPIYEEVATELKDKINVGKVNCDEEKTVCGQYGIRGYPTVYFKKNNELRSYNGQRTVDGFKKFVDGGWESVTAEAVPEPVSVWKAKFYDLLGAVESGVSTNMWVIIGACVVVGVLLGVVVIACTSGPQPAPKTIHYAAAPTSESDEVEDDSQPEEVANKDD